MNVGGQSSIAKHTCHAFKQLVTPLLDLVRMDVKVLRQFDQSSFILETQRHLLLP